MFVVNKLTIVFLHLAELAIDVKLDHETIDPNTQHNLKR